MKEATKSSPLPTWLAGACFTVLKTPTIPKRGIVRLEFDVLAWQMAGVKITKAAPRYVVDGNLVLLTTRGAPGWHQAGKGAGLPREGGRRYLAVSRLPESLRQEYALIVSSGYLVLAPPDVARSLNIPEHQNCSPAARSVCCPDEVDTPMPRESCSGYRWFRCSKSRLGINFLDVGGSIWSDIDCFPEDFVRVTKYTDGFVVEKCHPDEVGAIPLTLKKTPAGRPYAHKRFGSRLICVIGATKVRAVTGNGKIYFLSNSVQLAEFGICQGTPPISRKQTSKQRNDT